MRIGIDIVQSHPRLLALRSLELAQFASQIGHMRANFATFPLAHFMPCIDAIGRCILTDDEQFLCARGDQFLCLAQHSIYPAAGQFPAQLRNDAESTGMIATF